MDIGSIYRKYTTALLGALITRSLNIRLPACAEQCRAAGQGVQSVSQDPVDFPAPNCPDQRMLAFTAVCGRCGNAGHFPIR